jgi:hypothetical protein
MISKFKTDTRFQVSLVALIAMLIFVLIVLVRYDWDPMAFVMEGTRFREGVPNGTWGYDGQFAYYIALDPIGASDWMDHDAYRYQRILYPLLAWVFSFGGQPALIPWAMIAINMVCILTATWLLSGMLAERSVPPWVALSFVFFIGVFVALRGNLLEPLAISLSLLGLSFTYREKWLWAGVMFALAILAKEMALAFLLGIVAWQFLRQTPPSIWEKFRLLSLRGWGLLRHEERSSQRQSISFSVGNFEYQNNPHSSAEPNDTSLRRVPSDALYRQRLEQSSPDEMSLRAHFALSEATQSPPDNMSLRGAPSDALYRQRLKQSPSIALTDLIRHYRLPILLFLGGILPAIVWGVILTLWLGHSPMSAPFAAMERLPFYGLRYVGMSPAWFFILLWVALPAILFGGMGLWDIRRWKSSPEILILLANVALIAFMPRLTWYNIGGALRVAIGLVVASLLYIAVTRPKLMPWVSAYWVTSGLIMIPALIYAVE